MILHPRRIAEAKLDKDSETSTITEAKAEEGGWSITMSTGWSFWIPKKYGVEPKVGQSITQWPGGIGQPIRGTAIDGKILYYRTDGEQRLEGKAWAAEQEAKNIRYYVEHRDELDDEFSVLPKYFREKLQMLLDQGGQKVLWEPMGYQYQMFAFTEGFKIATALKTMEEVERFSKLPYMEQVKLVPGLSDQHSGNTFGMAVQYAYWYLKEGRV